MYMMSAYTKRMLNHGCFFIGFGSIVFWYGNIIIIKIPQNSVVFEIAWGDLSVIEYCWDIFATHVFE